MIKGIVNGAEKDIVRIPMKGKNLFDLNATDTSKGYISQNKYLRSDGTTYTPSGSTTWHVTEYIDISEFEDVTLSGLSGSASAPSMCFYDSEFGYISGKGYASKNAVTASVPSNARYLRFSIAESHVDEYMLNSGTAALPYEPYGYQEGWEVRKGDGTLIWGRNDTISVDSGTLPIKGYGVPLASITPEGNSEQSGTPTPTSPIDVTGCGDRTGNLFDKTDTKTTEVAGVYTYTLKGLTPNESYTCTTNFTTTSNVASIYFGGTATSTNGVTARSPRTMTADNNGNIVLYVRYASQGTTAPPVYNDLMDGTLWIMVNTGSTALPYEPFGYKIPITCAGQTVPVYLGEVPTVRRIKKLVLTGEESISAPSNDVFRFQVSGYMRRLGEIIGISTHYAVVACKDSISQWTANDELTFLVSSSGNNYMYIRDTAYNSSSTAFCQFLRDEFAAGTPVTVWYVLSEPTTGIVNEPLMKIGTYADTLTVTDQDATITPAVGNDTITVDTTLPPSKLTVVGHVRERTVT